MLRHRKTVFAMVIGGLLLMAGLVQAQETAPSHKPEGKPVKQQWVQMKDLPRVVQDTVKKQAGDHIIVSLKKIDYKNETRYSIRWIDGENLVIIHVSPTGEYLYRKTRPLDDDGNSVDNGDDEYDGGC